MFHPLTPKSDQHLISPNNIASELKKITRIKEILLTKEISWLLNKFSLSAP